MSRDAGVDFDFARGGFADGFADAAAPGPGPARGPAASGREGGRGPRGGAEFDDAFRPGRFGSDADDWD